jgi:hypothetical protein
MAKGKMKISIPEDRFAMASGAVRHKVGSHWYAA